MQIALILILENAFRNSSHTFSSSGFLLAVIERTMIWEKNSKACWTANLTVNSSCTSFLLKTIATLGIARSHGPELARVAPDIVLFEENLNLPPMVFELSQETMRLIKRYYRLTIGTNTTLLIAAAADFLPPVITSIPHNGTTFAVLLRALFGLRSIE